MKAYFSNSFDFLYQNLKENLLKTKFSDKNILFVPNNVFKEFLIKKFSEENISIISEIFQLSQAGSFFSKFIEKDLPNYFELSLEVEKKLLKNLSSPEFCEIASYIKFKRGRYIKNRFLEIVEETTKNFMLYGTYLKKFPKKCWQKILYDEVVSLKWSFLIKELQKQLFFVPKRYYLHFFSPNFTPQIFLYFSKNTFYYNISFCMHFWEDLYSDKEKKFFLKKSSLKENFLEEEHSLLRNFGKLQREFLKIFPDDVEIKDYYIKNSSQTTLSCIKEEILYMEKKEKIFLDSSIKVQNAPSKRREVEVLYDYVLDLIENKNIKISDITVAAPDIASYRPYIEMVFHKIPFKIFNVSPKSYFLKGILDYLDLIESRFEKEKIIKIFENESFMQKHHFSNEDIFLIKKWLKNITWGLDSHHKASFLQEEKKFSGTFKEGLQKVLLDVISFKEENFLKTSNFSDLELLEKFLLIFNNIKNTILLLEKKRFSLKKWIKILEEIAENFQKDTDAKNFDIFIDSIKKSKKYFPEDLWDVHTIKKHLIKALRRKNSSLFKNETNSIIFYSLKETVLPSKVICFLGMENFPRNSSPSIFNLLQDTSTYYPSQNDKDKNLLLLAVFLAEKYLYFSYVLKEEIFLSNSFQEFLKHIYCKKEVLEHFCHPFDKRYFSDERYRSFSQKNYLASKKYYQEKKEKNNFWILENKIEIPKKIMIEDLSLLAKNPWKFFSKKTLNISFAEKKEQKWFLSDLDKYIIKKESLKNSYKVIQKREDLFAPGMMGKIAKQQMFSFLQNLDIQKEDVDTFVLGGKEEKSFDPLEIFIKDQKIFIEGEILDITKKGIAIYADKKIESILAHWPKILIYFILCKKTSFPRSVYLIKSQEVLSFQSFDEKFFLEKYIHYYMESLKKVSPLYPIWSKSLLLKDLKSFEKDVSSLKKEDAYFSFFTEISSMDAEYVYEKWGLLLKDTFQPLIQSFS